MDQRSRVVLATTWFVVHLSQRTVSIRRLFNPAAATRYIKSVRENLTMHCISIFFYIKSENDTLEILKIANLLPVACEKKYSIIQTDARSQDAKIYPFLALILRR